MLLEKSMSLVIPCSLLKVVFWPQSPVPPLGQIVVFHQLSLPPPPFLFVAVKTSARLCPYSQIFAFGDLCDYF